MSDAGKEKKDLYKWIKIGGILSFLPFVLAAGPLSGYFLGDYLVKRFSLPEYIIYILIGIGIIASTKETIRMIKVALLAEKKQ